MDEPLSEPVAAWRVIRRHFVRIIIGAVLVVAVYGAVSVFVSYQTYLREKRIAEKIKEHGGRLIPFPDYLPTWIRDSIGTTRRIGAVDFTGVDVNPDVLSDLGLLASLERVFLDRTTVNDAGLQHLGGLRSLQHLTLTETQVTDAGLEHLKGLTSLYLLELKDTQCTAKGRAMLRKALPLCTVDPDP